MSSITLRSFWTHTTYGTWFQQLLCHPNKLMIGTLCPFKTLNHQLTNLEQTHIRSPLHCERWTVKWRDCASALHSFREITYRTDEWTKQLLRLKSWVISGNLEQWMEFRRLWWTVIVFKYGYLFHLFDLYCLLVQYSVFFLKIYFFVPFLWWISVRIKSSSTTSRWGNTPLDTPSRNLSLYIADVHPSVIPRCTLSSATTLYTLLQYLIRSVLCLVERHDIIINESLKSDYLSLYIANLIVSSRTLLNSFPCLSSSINKIGSDCLS